MAAMITGFACSKTRELWETRKTTYFPPDVSKRALVKLAQLDHASSLDELRNPPGNHLEALKGNRKGHHSIRANQQWRICFVWKTPNASQVELVDYH
jgi:proteic killer suppression protein